MHDSHYDPAEVSKPDIHIDHEMSEEDADAEAINGVLV